MGDIMKSRADLIILGGDLNTMPNNARGITHLLCTMAISLCLHNVNVYN